MSDPRSQPPLMRCTEHDCEMVESGRAKRPDGKWALAFYCARCNTTGGFTCRTGETVTIAPFKPQCIIGPRAKV